MFRISEFNFEFTIDIPIKFSILTHMPDSSAPKIKNPPDNSLLNSLHKVTIIYNKVNSLSGGEPSDILADEDTVKTAQSIKDTLEKDGIKTELFEVREDNFTDLLNYNTDLFFNICYGIGSIPKTEQEIPKLLDQTAIPYTGASSDSIKLTTDKVATKRIFRKEKIPTPKYQLFKNINDKLTDKLQFPLIVKPQMEDCSLGIHNDAVVNDEKKLMKKVLQLYQEYKQPILVERFINTRELNVTIIGNGSKLEVLPISEIIFGPSFESDNRWKIVDFEAKWLENTDNYKDTVGVCPAKLDQDIEDLITKYSIMAYKACNCRDYARIDIRLDEDNIPYFLELNLNPGIGPQDGAIRSAKVAGYTYSSFLKKLIEIALARYN